MCVESIVVMNMKLTTTKKIIVASLLVPILVLNISVGSTFECPMKKSDSGKKMACCNHESERVGGGQRISKRCCCEIAAAEAGVQPAVLFSNQNEVSKTIESKSAVATGLLNFYPESDSFHNCTFEYSTKNKRKQETKIYTLISSFLI